MVLFGGQLHIRPFAILSSTTRGTGTEGSSTPACVFVGGVSLPLCVLHAGFLVIYSFIDVILLGPRLH